MQLTSYMIAIGFGAVLPYPTDALYGIGEDNFVGIQQHPLLHGAGRNIVPFFHRQLKNQLAGYAIQRALF